MAGHRVKNINFPDNSAIFAEIRYHLMSVLTY